jgi:hypothetical protein
MSAYARAYLADMYGRDWIPMHQYVSISSYDEPTYYSYATATDGNEEKIIMVIEIEEL